MKKWTDKDVKKLLFMKNYNYNLKEISQVFQITVNAVSKALKRYHVGYIKSQTNEDQSFSTEKRIVTLSRAINVFNQTATQPIYCSGVDEYSYGLQEGLSSVSILIIINEWRVSNHLEIFKIYNLAI